MMAKGDWTDSRLLSGLNDGVLVAFFSYADAYREDCINEHIDFSVVISHLSILYPFNHHVCHQILKGIVIRSAVRSSSFSQSD